MNNNVMKNDVSNNTIAIKNKTDDSNLAGTVVALGALGGGGYLVYKKSKKEK